MHYHFSSQKIILEIGHCFCYFFDMGCLTTALNNSQQHTGYHIINILIVGFKNQVIHCCGFNVAYDLVLYSTG